MANQRINKDVVTSAYLSGADLDASAETLWNGTLRVSGQPLYHLLTDRDPVNQATVQRAVLAVLGVTTPLLLRDMAKSCDNKTARALLREYAVELETDHGAGGTG